MAATFQRFWRAVRLSAGALWLALIAFYGFYVFVYPTVPNYGPEIGPVASFIYACLLFSLCYLSCFLFVVIPVACVFRFIFSRHSRSDVPRT